MTVLVLVNSIKISSGNFVRERCLQGGHPVPLQMIDVTVGLWCRPPADWKSTRFGALWQSIIVRQVGWHFSSPFSKSHLTHFELELQRIANPGTSSFWGRKNSARGWPRFLGPRRRLSLNASRNRAGSALSRRRRCGVNAGCCSVANSA